MQPSQPSRRRAWLPLLPTLSALALALLVAACAPGPQSQPLSTSTPENSAPRVGVDADGNFYRGDPNAPVKLVEFSEFQ